MKHEHGHEHNDTHREATLSRGKLALVGFLIIAGYVLLMEHRAHLGSASSVLYYLPFLFLLACPVMHIFMHGGHHAHERDKSDSDEKKGDV